VIHRTQDSGSELSVLPSIKPSSKEETPDDKESTSHRLRILFQQWSSGNGACSLPQRVEQLTTAPFIAWAPCCLNFLMDPHKTIPLSMTTSRGHLPPRHCGRMSVGPLRWDYSLFSGSQSNSVWNTRTHSKSTWL
jgi:hypothetical protein